MKKALLFFAIVFQFFALSWMALSREYIIQTGEVVKIQTAPIDPRDLFRGDFVRLNFGLSELSADLLEPHLVGQTLKKGQLLFVKIKASSKGLVTAISVTDSKPDSEQLFIKGRLTRNWSKSKYGSNTLAVKYGIEQYFVEQGKGIDIENKRGRRNELQIPMIMHVALSGSGTAVIKGHEWGDIGLALKVERQPERDAEFEAASAVMKLELKNVSNRTLQLPFKTGNCSFRIQTIKTAPQKLTLNGEGCDLDKPVQETLKPGDSRFFTFDLNHSQWYVQHKKKQTPMGKLPWEYRFRLVYDGTSVSHLNGDIISQAFHGRGQVD
jgi:uncharacterized membrane-anchored protein